MKLFVGITLAPDVARVSGGGFIGGVTGVKWWYESRL
jgi:hypothetical protein